MPERALCVESPIRKIDLLSCDTMKKIKKTLSDPNSIVHATEQMKFWQGRFGDAFIDRISGNFDEYSKKEYCITPTSLNNKFLSKISKNARILEVGCNFGRQLELLKNSGFTNLWGIDINDKALCIAKSNKEFHVVRGSALDIPFKDGFFDIVFTSYVLIHIHPKNLTQAIREMYRVSNRYLWGAEFFSSKCEKLNYRGHKNKMWRNNFPKLFLEEYPDLTIVKEKRLPYLKDKNVDVMYLLRK